MPESSVAHMHGRTCSLDKTQGNIAQLALTYAPPAPVLTCTRVMPWGACKGTKFRRFAGPTGVAYRCEKCAGKADSAMCSCSHGYGAHGSHGCMGVLDSGDLCECQLRGGR